MLRKTNYSATGTAVNAASAARSDARGETSDARGETFDSPDDETRDARDAAAPEARAAASASVRDCHHPSSSVLLLPLPRLSASPLVHSSHCLFIVRWRL